MGINKAILVGNLGKDPELKYTNQQLPVCTFSLATGEKRKDASGNWVDHTEWHTIVAFGKTAEHCSNYLKKGKQVFVEGKIQTRKWQDKEGKDRYTTEILASNVQFLGSRSEANGGQYVSSDNEESVPFNAVMGSLKTADRISPDPGDIKFDDDDIPF